MIDCIENIEKLSAALGSSSFYDFHDGEIVSVSFDRKMPVTITLVLQLKRRLREYEVEGKMWDQFRVFDVTFVFAGVRNSELENFNPLNIIEELRIVPDENHYLVHFKQILGCDLKFLCERMELTGIETSEVDSERFVHPLDRQKP